MAIDPTASERNAPRQSVRNGFKMFTMLLLLTGAVASLFTTPRISLVAYVIFLILGAVAGVEVSDRKIAQVYRTPHH